MKPLGICCDRSFYDRKAWNAHQIKHRIEKSGTGPLLTTHRKSNQMSTKTSPAPSNVIKSTGDLFVVETDEATYLGYIEEIPATTEDEVDVIKVRTGFRGHPFVLQKVDVDSITPAAGHPYVEWL